MPALPEVTPDPVFDPENVRKSLDVVQAQFPFHFQEFRGTVVGDFSSRLKGHGYDVDDIREYEAGDDVSQIDWPATMSLPDRWPHVREHYQDVMPSMWIVTDALQPRHQKNPGYFSEQNLALSAIAAFMRMAYVQHLPFAAIASDGRMGLASPRGPSQGRNHMLRTASNLVRHLTPEDGSEPKHHLADLLRFTAGRATKSVVVVVSDFRDVAYPDDKAHGWQKPLQRLAHQQNQLLAVETINPWDKKLPDTIDPFRVNDGYRWISNDKAGLREREQYKVAAEAQQKAIDKVLKDAKAHHIKLQTAEPSWVSSFRTQLRKVKS